MTEIVEDYSIELQGLIEEIEQGLVKLKADKKMKPEQRTEKIVYLENRIDRAKKVYKSYKLEMRDLTKVEADPYKKKGAEYEDSINKCIQDLNWIQDSSNLEGTKKENLDTMTSDQILMKASKTQDESVQALDRMLVTLEGTKEVGAETANTMAQQTDQLKAVGEGVLEVQNNLKEANKLLRAFARRVATDKILMGFMCLLVLAIVALIVVKIVKKKTSGGGGLVT
ncbi:hypothetical protein PROFUN_03535 [Planoprotostelium fungivorum]|uniref:t-SNARE coiled-coil homology domain-containing protein n=1 Tax=Planoprotostelium fungivorum TaxID=1890364 RepID=A0A2P6MSD8_9EUKA|nr:hypothetical protein PROFUN_03535 [Planoprotostelium fungivorum]